MEEMAFVSAVPVLSSSARPKSSLTGRSLTTTKPTSNHEISFSTRKSTNSTVNMQQVEFQTFSGGLDQISVQPYSITRYLFQTSAPVSIDEDDKDSAILKALRHIFGNAYLMEEERAEFYTYESKYRCGEITAREFTIAIAKSATYRKRFFENVSQFRFIELNFKHFLGRAPLNQVEYSKHFKIFQQGGYEAEIESYFGEIEYDQVFGDDTFPFLRFKGTYAPINQFNRMCTIQGGFAGSDKNKGIQLTTSLASNVPTPAYSVVDGLPIIPNSEHPSQKYNLPSASLEQYKNELEIAKAKLYKLQIDLKDGYAKFDTYRGGFSAFTDMVKSMDINKLPGSNFTGIKVENYPTWSGPNSGAKPWGKAGVDRLNGVVKRPAAEIGKKEKEFERIKQLCVDLERRVSILQAERDSPAVTPDPIPFTLEGLSIIEIEEEDDDEVDDGAQFVQLQKEKEEDLKAKFDTTTLITTDIDVEDEESQLSAPKSVEVETSRKLKDVGKLPKQLMKELEEKTKAEGKGFLGPEDGRLKFPGDGSEMSVG